MSTILRAFLVRTLDGRQRAMWRVLLCSTVLFGLAAPRTAQGALPDVVQILRVSPGDGVSEAPRATPIVIFFDRPMVSLSAIEASAPAAPARLEPLLPGHGRWVNTATWAWYPSFALNGATRYTVIVPAGLRAVDGTTLPASYYTSFSTVRPAVARTSPADTAAYTDFRAPIMVRFNQSMDRASVSAAFSLRDATGRVIPGAVTWSRPDTLIFRPATWLVPGGHYSATVARTIHSSEGALPASGDASWSFTTAGIPRVTDTAPIDGDRAADMSQGLVLHVTAPVDARLVRMRVHIVPRLRDLSVGVSDDGLTVYVYGSYAPSTRYRVALDGVVGTFGQVLARPLQLGFTTAPLPAAVQFAYSNGIVSFDAYRPVDVALRGVNSGALDLNLYALSRDDFVGLLQSSDLERFTPSSAPMLSMRRRLSARLNVPQSIGQELASPGSSMLAPGFYFLRVQGAHGGVDQMAFMVTRTALTFKTSAGRALVWATDLRSGRPLPRLLVRVVRSDDRGLVMGGHTGADGVIDAPFAHPTSYTMIALLDRPGDAALCSTNWGGGVQPYNYTVPGSSGPSSSLGYLYTDRPIYRPGHTIDFRGVVRRDDDGAYGLPVAGTPLRVTLGDATGHIVYSGLARLDAYGAFAGTIRLPAGAALGTDVLNAQMGDQTFSTNVQVAAYRKPDYAVVAAPTRPDANYTSGSPVRVTVAARYLFGAPLNEARVHWSVITSTLYFNSPSYPDYTFQDYPYVPFPRYDSFARAGSGVGRSGYPAPADGSSSAGGAYSGRPCGSCGSPDSGVAAQGDARTDANGNLTLSIPADLARSRLSQQWSVEADVSDINHASVSGRTVVQVHKGLFYVGLRGPSALVVAGRPARLDLLTLWQDGATLVPRVPLTVRLYRRTYRTVNVPSPYGGLVPDWQPVDTLLASFPAATGANGHGSLHITLPRSGEYRIAGAARDARGNLVRSAISLYAAGADEAASPWANPPQDRIRLVPDRTLYHIGDVARVLVAAPRPGMTALVTIERGRVYSHQVLRFTGASPVLRIPVLARYLPDMFVSVVVVAGAGPRADAPLWKMGVAELAVDVRARQVRLSVHSVTRAQPGQQIGVRLHATDAAGHPVRGEFSLGVVDQGVLELAQEAAPAILDAFYAERGLGVATAYSQNVAALQATAQSRAVREQYTVRRSPASKRSGGGGGGVAGAAADGASARGAAPRAYFPDTAYWNPAVTTGATGDATAVVTLPDSLTTWHLVARGVTADTLVGESALDVISTRDLLLRPLLPRFFALGDGAQVGTVVNNTTGRALMAHVTLRVSGAAGSALFSTDITVGPTGERLVTWPLRPVALGTARLLLAVSAPGAGGDSIAVAAPVEPNSTPETVATSGEVGTARLEQIVVPAGAQRGEGGLTLTLQPSLAAGLRSSADLLRHEPFQSSEDIAARIMGEVALVRLPAAATGLSPATLADYRRDIVSRISQLLDMQRGDGGWGWWIEDLYSSPAITAFCLDALGVARRAGYPVLSRSIVAGTGYVSTQAHEVASSPLAVPTGPVAIPPDLQAYMAYILVASGSPGAGTALFPSRDRLPLWSRAYLLRALFLENDHHLGPRGRTVLAELESRAHLDAAGAHWESSGDGLTMDDATHATAVVLDALMEVDPTSPLIPPATRWLMSARRGETWETTVDNAVALRALSDELRGSGELAGRYAYTATIGGATWGSGNVSPVSLATPRLLTAPLGPALTPGATTRVGLNRSNTSGRLYYTLRLSYYPRVETVQPLARGLAITREYLYHGHPVTSAPVGAVLQVRLTVTAAQDLYYVGIEDPLPAGAEAVDPSLLTTSQLQQGGYTVPRGTGDLAWYISHAELRDDRTALFLPYLAPGVYRYEYTVHLTTTGLFHALPAHAAETYFPEVFGRSAGGYLSVH